MLHESVHTPIDLLFAAAATQPRIPGLAAAAPAPSNASRSTMTNRGKQRPAVIWDDDIVDDSLSDDLNTPVRACLMASFEGFTTYQSLPDVLKNHFCLPVSPHCEITEGIPHLHTAPEWVKHHTWLIASPFSSFAKVSGRWQWEDEKQKRHADHSFRVDDAQYIKLRAVCENRLVEWMTRCVNNEEYIADCKTQYDVSGDMFCDRMSLLSA